MNVSIDYLLQVIGEEVVKNRLEQQENTNLKTLIAQMQEKEGANDGRQEKS